MDLPHPDIEDQKIRENFQALAAAIGQPTFRRLYIPTEESASSASYVTLTTPDVVKNVPMPTGGYIAVGYEAMWKQSDASAATAAIFLGDNQVVRSELSTAAPAVQAALFSNPVVDTYKPLSSYYAGLAASTGVSATEYTGDATTGQIVGTFDASGGFLFGGVCFIFAEAGIYDVSIRFAAATGTVTAKERKLTVWTVGASSGQAA